MPCSSARNCSSASARSSAVGGEPRQAQQRVAAVDVQARRAATPAPAGLPSRAYGIGAREKYRAKSSLSTTTLVDVRVVEVGRILDAPAQRAHLQRRLARERRHRLVDHPRLDERLVALDVDDDIAVSDAATSASRSVPLWCASDVISTSPPNRERPQRSVDRRSPRSPRDRPRRAWPRAVDVLDHRPAGDVCQRLAWKPRRVVSGGNDGDGETGSG